MGQNYFGARTASSLVISSVGAILTIGTIIEYQLLAGPTRSVGQAEIGFAEDVAYATLGFFLLGIGMTFYGATSLLRNLYLRNSNSRFSILASVSLAISGRKGGAIFGAAAMIYGFVFAIISSVLVFQPRANFSELYGVKVPSIVPVICCGGFGQMPQFVIYLSQHFALLVIPLNLILICVVSWLVGINAASIGYLLAHRSVSTGPKWVGGLGAIVGLFTACPACAGLFFLSTLGSSGAAAAALTLASLQGIFVVVGIPILLCAVFLNSRQIRISCNPDELAVRRSNRIRRDRRL